MVVGYGGSGIEIVGGFWVSEGAVGKALPIKPNNSADHSTANPKTHQRFRFHYHRTTTDAILTFSDTHFINESWLKKSSNLICIVDGA